MSRFTIGAALGGATVYFFDPTQGEERRRRLQSLWRENRDTAHQVGAGVSQAAETMRPLARRVRRGLEQGDWVENSGAGWASVLAGMFVATALGGAAVYLLDPQNGPVRRKRMRTFMHQEKSALGGGIRSVKNAVGTVGSRVTHAVAEA